MIGTESVVLTNRGRDNTDNLEERMMNWQKGIYGAVLAGTLLWAGPAWGAGIYYDGQAVAMNVAPVVVEGRALVPLKMLEQMGDVVVDWQEERQTAVVLTGTPEAVTALAVPAGSSRAYQLTGTLAEFDAIGVSTDNIDWERVQIIPLDVPAQIVEGRMMVPLRVISEALGYQVTWDSVTETVLIDPPAKADQPEDAAGSVPACLK